jgi:hypothetical protein
MHLQLSLTIWYMAKPWHTQQKYIQVFSGINKIA